MSRVCILPGDLGDIYHHHHHHHPHDHHSADLGEGVGVGPVPDHLLGDLGGVQQAWVHPSTQVNHAVGVSGGRVHSFILGEKQLNAIQLIFFSLVITVYISLGQKKLYLIFFSAIARQFQGDYESPKNKFQINRPINATGRAI